MDCGLKGSRLSMTDWFYSDKCLKIYTPEPMSNNTLIQKIKAEIFVGWLFCFMTYKPFQDPLSPNYISNNPV